MTKKKPKKSARFYSIHDPVYLSRPPTTSQERKNYQIAQTSRNKRVKVTLAPTPWDKDKSNG